MKFILGKKIDMTQTWVGDNKKAVTRVQAGPAVVLQLKTKERDGYTAVQLGCGEKKGKNLTKPVLGHLKKLGNCRWIKEFRVEEKDLADLHLGDIVKADTFAVGDKVTVTGWSKGRGFSGVVKRHGFHGQDATHGNKDQLRMPGSIGSGGVQRVFKGMRMPGHLGAEQVTFHNAQVVQVDEAANIIYLEGGVPGARGSLVLLKAPGELKVSAKGGSVSGGEGTEMKEEPVATENSNKPQVELTANS
jgi:large subunit ribosomal protein L3